MWGVRDWQVDGKGVRSGMDLSAQDFYEITAQIVEISRYCCPGRVVSVLEG